MRKGKNRFTQAEVEKLQQLSERLKKEEPLTEEQNDYMATTLMLMQTPLKWTVIEAFLMSPLTQLFLERVLNRMLVNGWEDCKDSIL